MCGKNAADTEYILGYFVKSVDLYNINNAFVSGMYVPTNGGITDRELLSANGDFFSRKEDLKLYNNQLNYIQTAYALGYSLGQIPSNLILSRARPRYWIPSLEVKTAVYD